MANRSVIAVFGLGMLCWSSISFAESLTDPTRPLATESTSTAKTAQETTAAALPRLQSILIGPGSRKAMIDEQIYRQGDTFNQFKISAIHSDRVVLTGPQGKVTLRLFNQKVRYP